MEHTFQHNILFLCQITHPIRQNLKKRGHGRWDFGIQNTLNSPKFLVRCFNSGIKQTLSYDSLVGLLFRGRQKFCS